MLGRILRKIRSMALHRRIRSESEWLRQNPFNKIDRAELEKNKELLRPQYNKYISEVSSASMAGSLELAALLLTLCRAGSYKKMVDLGSGFTSYVLRLYAGQTPGAEVYSVDDDAQWLEKTRDFLHTAGVSDRHLMTLDNFLQRNERGFDLILHDLNFVEVRIGYVDDLAGRLSPRGIFLLDDMHKPDYRVEVLSKIPKLNLDIYTLQGLTGDQLGRYSMVAMKSN